MLDVCKLQQFLSRKVRFFKTPFPEVYLVITSTHSSTSFQLSSFLFFCLNFDSLWISLFLLLPRTDTYSSFSPKAWIIVLLLFIALRSLFSFLPSMDVTFVLKYISHFLHTIQLIFSIFSKFQSFFFKFCIFFYLWKVCQSNRLLFPGGCLFQWEIWRNVAFLVISLNHVNLIVSLVSCYPHIFIRNNENYELMFKLNVFILLSYQLVKFRFFLLPSYSLVNFLFFTYCILLCYIVYVLLCNIILLLCIFLLCSYFVSPDFYDRV